MVVNSGEKGFARCDFLRFTDCVHLHRQLVLLLHIITFLFRMPTHQCLCVKQGRDNYLFNLYIRDSPIDACSK